ncbi:FKBP-type peptidyl-prolyl cis-trans isomerase [Bernardetia litoralis DSM 6794]|uniref:peptidylprolyl isomerase n=1 Tax=Bernardetia litoralis (strain ATCC 23117 / DSM 6794 / NBRC 15988 / NCIMB 1366 / Fx l1 / Sio-4) TaxID=880071 RepID=I4AGW9_BERLS|nr:FKBP-type peptidyl-prolyl cis-trans isomerase [Bernardetia litoralis]AFM03204.1 FKBP-type peptidyl-prolyl cis-trans isomerase [Bernardetia litoralis DSM 6794]
MVHKFILLFTFFIISLSVSAQFEEGMKEHKGIHYEIHQIGKGQPLTDSSIVQIQMKVFNAADSLLQSTYTEDFPALLNLRDSNNRKMPLVEVLIKGKIGDSLTVFTSSDSIYQGYNASMRPDFIPEGSWIRQEFQLGKNYTLEEYEEVMALMQQRQQEKQDEYMKEMMAQQQEMERKSDSISELQVKYIEDTYFVEKEITEYQKTESGLLYLVEKQGTEINEGEKVSVHYKGTVLKTGEKFDSSYDRENPIEFTIGQGQVIKGWDEGIPLIGRGGKGVLYIPSNLAYGSQGAGAAIQPNEMIVFEVEVVDELEEEQQTTSQKDPNTYYIDDNQEDYIENVYLKLNNITDYKKTESGLFYKIEKQGTPIKKGEKLRVHYEGTTLMTGEQFDSSFDREKPIEITIGENNFIDGWEEGIPLIGKGGKGTLYIPAKLAYGEKGLSEQIPPNSILIYRVEILED